jgi:hypothetical protein
MNELALANRAADWRRSDEPSTVAAGVLAYRREWNYLWLTHEFQVRPPQEGPVHILSST